MPTVIDINTNNLDWEYSTSGHYMCTSGYWSNSMDSGAGDEKKAYVYYADPHPTRYGTYKKTTTKVYNANKAHWRSAIVW